MIQDDSKVEIRRLKNEGKKVVSTNGRFDVLHPAHMRLLKKAKSLGDVLVVLLNSDESIKTFTGKDPINPEYERREMLECLPWVDYVITFDEDSPLVAIEELGPDVLVKGGTFEKDRLEKEEKLIKKLGGELNVLPLEKEYLRN